MPTTYYGFVRNSFQLLSCLTVCLCLAGCGGKEAQVAGLWVGEDLKLPGMATLPAGLAAMAKSRISTATLNLRQDRHFDMLQYSGTWSLKDDKVILKVDTIGGAAVAEKKKEIAKRFKSLPPEALGEAENAMSDQLTGTLGPDGKTISVANGKFMIVFRKKS